jgi:hypothetical protein
MPAPLLHQAAAAAAAQLVQHLIATAVVRGHTALAPALAATPAAQQLSTQQVTQLLYTCIQLEQPQQVSGEAELLWNYNGELAARWLGVLPCFMALWALPSAQSISASTVAAMMQLAAQQQRYWLGMQLCGLPAAQQVSPRELCELLVSALEHGDDSTGGAAEVLVEHLLNLPAAQQLPQGPQSSCCNA